MLKLNLKNTKAKIILTLFLTISLGAGGGAVYYFGYYKKPKPAEETPVPETVQEKPVAKTVACKLDGAQTSKENANRRPIAVMIENHSAARPQSGLNKADIVYEALAEGGITRFMAVFACDDAQAVGPVRSARPYYLDWASEFNAPYAHVGGSATALENIKKYNILDMDQSYNSKYFDRVTWRAAPHNVYTSTDRLYSLVSAKGWPEEVDYKTYTFKEEEVESSRPQSQEVSINYNSSYVTRFVYDPAQNDYLRFQGKTAFMDKATNEQIRAKNVVVLEMKTGKEDASRLTMTTVGTGKARIYIDGKEQIGTWKKTSRTDLTRFYDSLGQEIKFNRGAIWMVVAPVGTGIVAK